MKTLRGIFYLFLLAAGLSAAAACYYAHTNLSHRNPSAAIVYFEKGRSVRAIGAELARLGVVRDRFFFEAYARATGLAEKLKAGEYEFEAGLTLKETLVKMAVGKTKVYRYTIPEGFDIRGVCKVIEETRLRGREKCEGLVRDAGLLREPAGKASLEGYLFPETYTYDSQTTLKKTVKAMVGTFYEKFGPEREARARAGGLSLHSAVTLASVVEKETGLAGERALIAGVFFNRLKAGMPLQSDPTVIYGIADFNGNLTRADLENDHAYNTYTRPGLPAGPICNPGLAALDAVLNPAPTRALYFVAKGDGGHYFSETLDEHNRAVRHYQLKQGPPP